MKELAKISGLILIALIISVASVVAESQRSTNIVVSLPSGTIVEDAYSKLVRTDTGISMNLHTSQLKAGDAYTIWWVIFNKPEKCANGIFGLRCGERDLFNPDVDASVIYAAGNIAGNDGKSNFGGHLNVGDITGCILCNNGLTNPMGADIHLIVHDHGPMIPGLVDEQIHTFNGGCNPGEPNVGLCKDVQASPHESI